MIQHALREIVEFVKFIMPLTIVAIALVGAVFVAAPFLWVIKVWTLYLFPAWG